MSVVLNPYNQHKAQLGTIEAGLKTLKRDTNLMSDVEFSDMYSAVEKHHRELRLAHLTGKSKDLMEQAEKDTKFYNILIKMLCEVKKLPSKQRKETLRKVHLWYEGNRHTLATGPRFGKNESHTTSKGKDGQKQKSGKHTKSETSLHSQRSNKENQSSKSRPDVDQQKTGDDISSMRGFGDSINPPSEPASSRMSVFGNDFLTNRFMNELPSSKLSWHIDTPYGKSAIDGISTSDWDGQDIELQRVGESSLSHRTFDEYISHPTADSAGSPRSVLSDVESSGVDVGSMMEFHSDVKRRFSSHRNPASSDSMVAGETDRGGTGHGGSDDQSSAGGYGLPRKMVHSIASLVNPHAKLAESEAKRMEQDYIREQLSSTPYRAVSRTSSHNKGGGTDLNAHIPVLRAVSVASNRGDNLKVFDSFRQDHIYGQDILSRLNFVGRSGTALDVRYSSHTLADQPENHTHDLIQLYSLYTAAGGGHTRNLSNTDPSTAKQSESMIHNQTLEEFYQSADNYSPSPVPRYNSSIRSRSAPAPRVNSAQTNQQQKTGSKISPRKTSTVQKLGKSLLENKVENDAEDEILYTSDDRPQSAVKLETVVNMIDHVKDEMNYFREKLAPTPMSGFRQPSSTNVSNRPLSRPTSTASRKSRPVSSQKRSTTARSPSPQGRPGTPQEDEGEIMMGKPEVPSDTFKTTVALNRPHSATVNRAVDWRGKVTPEAARIKSKMRFGGHSYVQKLKPSLRTAGAVGGGKRPKTAPTLTRETWSNKDKETEEDSPLPPMKVQNFPSIVPTYPYYPVKHEKSQTLPVITITECSKNERVSAQAASNTMTQVDDKDMDKIMNIQHIMGSSDSRYGSMNSLFFDDDFLRSMNARYRKSPSMGQLTSPTKEYISFSVPIGTPRKSPSDARVSRLSARNTEVSLIPEEEVTETEDTEIPPLQLDQQESEGDVEQAVSNTSCAEPPVINPSVQQSVDNTAKTVPLHEGISDGQATHTPAVKQQTDSVDIQLVPEESTKRSQVDDTNIVNTDSNVEEQCNHVEVNPESIAEQQTGDIYIEVTKVSGKQKHLLPEKALESLSVSETWHYQPTDEVTSVKQDEITSVRQESPKSKLHKHHYLHHRHDHELHSQQQEQLVKSIVRPENYCFHCLPDTMTTKVGRSAGRMPGGTQSPAGQVLRMARRQNECYKKSPPVRTPPSIPSTQHLHSTGQTTPRQGRQYSSELEHHARKVKSPRHFMEQANSRLRI